MIYNIQTIEDFNSFSQKLKKHIQNKIPENNIKLSLIHESLAQSMGYRNLNGLQSFIKKKTNHNIEKILNECDSEEILDFLNLFKTSNSEDLWQARADILNQLVISTLVELRNKKQMFLSLDVIDENLKLDNLIKLSKDNLLSKQNQKKFESYLNSLPGYQEDLIKQRKTTQEQHGYLQMQIQPIISKIENIKNDVIIFPYIGEPDDFDKYEKNLLKHNINKLPWISNQAREPAESLLLDFNIYKELYNHYGKKDYTLFDFIQYTLNYSWNKKAEYKVIIDFMIKNIRIIKKNIDLYYSRK